MIILKRKSYTSIGWKLKKPIGRARKAVAESLVKSSKKNDKNITSISAKLKESSRVDNPELEEKLKKRIMEDGITISNGPRNSYVKSTRTIRYNSGGAETLAHEYGHALGDIHNLPSR